MTVAGALRIPDHRRTSSRFTHGQPHHICLEQRAKCLRCLGEHRGWSEGGKSRAGRGLRDTGSGRACAAVQEIHPQSDLPKGGPPCSIHAGRASPPSRGEGPTSAVAGFSRRLSHRRARYPKDVGPEPSSASSGNALARSGRRRTRRGRVAPSPCDNELTRHTSDALFYRCDETHGASPALNQRIGCAKRSTSA